jgi:hypothetical protein
VYFFTSQPSGYLACNGGTQISVQLSAATFCASNTYTSNYFTSLGTTSYWLAYEGNYVTIFHSGSNDYATRGGTCQVCNNTPPPTSTPLPTSTPEPTATPTPTPNPSNCECYTVYNEAGDRSIIFQYPRCSDGTLASQSVAQGAVVTVCVYPGGDITDSSGLLTAVACGTPCTINGDCADCN